MTSDRNNKALQTLYSEIFQTLDYWAQYAVDSAKTDDDIARYINPDYQFVRDLAVSSPDQLKTFLVNFGHSFIASVFTNFDFITPLADHFKITLLDLDTGKELKPISGQFQTDLENYRSEYDERGEQ